MARSDIIAMPRAEYLEHAITECRRKGADAEEAGSWSAVERLMKLEAELKGELCTIREIEAGRGATDLDPETALAQIILPALGSWPRSFVERLFKACALKLGISLDRLAA